MNKIKLLIVNMIDKQTYITILNKVLFIFLKPNVAESKITLNKIINERLSVSRYGDGEFALMQGKDLKFQEHDFIFENRLKEIIKSTEKNHIVCIPYNIVDLNILNSRAQDYWNSYWKVNRFKIYTYLNFKKKYYDSFISRFYMDIKDKSQAELTIKELKKIWHNRDIVIIEGEKSRLGIGNDLFSNCKEIKRIICPSENAYSEYNDILNRCKTIEKDKLFLIALGPTATVLAYDLSKYGYQAIDIGHIDIEYEWYLMGTNEKCPIKYKYVGEAVNGTNVDDIKDAIYNRQILCKVLNN